MAVTATRDEWVEEYLAAERRTTLGGLRLASGRRASDAQTAGLIGAANLITKAGKRLAAGDETAARDLVERALRLPADEPGALDAGAFAAHAAVVQALSDVIARSPEAAGRLEPAIALLETASPDVARELARALENLLERQDLTRRERERIRRAILAHDTSGAPFAEVPGAGQRADLVLALLRIVPGLRASD